MSQTDDKSTQSSMAGTYRSGTGKPRRPRRRRFGIIAALMAALLIILVILFFLPRPTATVTLKAASKSMSNSAVLSLPARQISSTQQGTQTGNPSGQSKPGTHATGTLTFKNYTPNAVTIPAGTLLTDITGQQVVTDKALLVPPDPIIPGVASVSAHAVKTGISGNIRAMSINKPCCFSGIFVLNQFDFKGGVNDQTSAWVQQSDVDSIAKTLEPSLTQKSLTDMQSQLKAGEQLVDATPSCSAKVTSNPAVGQSASSLTVTVTLACSDSAYNAQTALTQIEDLLRQKAEQQFGPGFVLSGKIASTIKQVTPGTAGNVDVLASASGIWKYQFTDAIKSNIARHITRATVADANAWLLQQTGVADASISVSGPIINLGGNNNLPDDLRAITING